MSLLQALCLGRLSALCSTDSTVTSFLQVSNQPLCESRPITLRVDETQPITGASPLFCHAPVQPVVNKWEVHVPECSHSFCCAAWAAHRHVRAEWKEGTGEDRNTWSCGVRASWVGFLWDASCKWFGSLSGPCMCKFNCAAWHELNLKCKLLGKKLSEHHSWDFSHPPPARLAGTAGPHQLVLPVWFHHREVSVSTPVSLSSHTFVYYKERCNAPDKDLGPCACFFFLFFFHDLNPGVDCSCVTQLQRRFHYAHICFCFEIWAQTSWQHKAVSYEYNNLLSTKIRP